LPPEQPLLAFDTSAAHCAAALLLHDKIIAQTREDMAKGQAERLMPMIEEMLVAAGFNWRNLAAVAVGIGPGNFTGIRISVAAARGLALGLGVPAVGVTGLDVLAFATRGPCRVALPASRGALYLQDFMDGTACAAPFEMAGDDSALWPQDSAVALIGDWPRLPVDAQARILRPDADARLRALARIGALRVAQAAPLPAPFYMRAADAAPPSDPPPVILDDPA
jgi:tRNA threonylcarbamoyladenosine biosynthesis protein TsaB